MCELPWLKQHLREINVKEEMSMKMSCEYEGLYYFEKMNGINKLKLQVVTRNNIVTL